jgi:hypothetical protein
LLDEINHALSRPKFKKYLRVPVSRFIEVIGLAVTIPALLTRQFNPPKNSRALLPTWITSSILSKSAVDYTNYKCHRCQFEITPTPFNHPTGDDFVAETYDSF